MKINKSFNPHKVKKILIVNVHSSKNAGDYALLIQTMNYLQKSFGAINMTIMANWPEEPAIKELGNSIIGSPWWIIKVWEKRKKPRFQVLSLLLGILWLLIYRIDIFHLASRVIPKAWNDLFLEYRDSDLVVAVSGNQLFSSGRLGWPLLVVGFPIYLARFFNKKMIVFPQSVGPLNSKFDRWYVHFLYDNVDKVYVRDKVSLELLDDLNIRKSKPSFMHDVAFTFPPDNQESLLEFFPHKEHLATPPKLGMTIISNMPSYLSPDNMTCYYQNMAKTIHTLIDEHGFDIFLFCQVYGPTDDENDELGIKRVVELLPNPHKKYIHIINHRMHPAQLKAIYGLMDIFIASRLHSGIFSLSMNVPTLFIGYLYKTIGVLKAINLDEFYIDLQDISYLHMVNKILAMWKEKNKIKERIHSKMKIIEKDLANFPKIIIADLENDHEN